jgi:hypothetical protein
MKPATTPQAYLAIHQTAELAKVRWGSWLRLALTPEGVALVTGIAGAWCAPAALFAAARTSSAGIGSLLCLESFRPQHLVA